MTRCAGEGTAVSSPPGESPPVEDAARGPLSLGARVRRQRMWRPEIARAMTRRWISLVPSKMV